MLFPLFQPVLPLLAAAQLERSVAPVHHVWYNRVIRLIIEEHIPMAFACARVLPRSAAAVLGLLLVGCVSHNTTTSTAPSTTPSTTAPPVIRYLALGDSYTIGEHVQPSERWPVQLMLLLRDEGWRMTEPVIVAQTGWTTDELIQGIEQADITAPFDLVSLLIGVNNQYRGRELEEYRRQFRHLLQQAIHFAQDRPSHVIVLSIPDWSVTPVGQAADAHRITTEIDRFNAINREETEQLGARYLDIAPSSRTGLTDSALIAGDGLHPAAKMYTQWAELALPHARAALVDAHQ